MKKNETIDNAIPALETKPKSYAPVEVKPITRAQLKEMRAKGLDPNYRPKVEPHVVSNNDNPAEMVDFIIDVVYAGIEEVENLEYYQLLELATDTYKRAYQGPDSIKN